MSAPKEGATSKKNKTSDPKIVFVVGCPRSGTTWMMWLLAQHPSVVVCHHGAFFHALKPLRDWWQYDVGYGKSIYVPCKNEKEGKGNEAGDNHTKVSLNEILSIDEFYNYSRELGLHVFGKIASCGNETQVVVEKTPENLQFSEWILKIFPEAYILHVIRDPRSVYSSNCKAVYSWAEAREFPTSPIQAAKRWRAYIERGKQTRKKSDNYREIRYEALHQDGVKELGEIYSWLNLPTSPDILEQAVEASTIDKLRNCQGLAPKGFFRKGAVEAWQEELSRSEINIIEYISGNLMEEFGYKRSLNSVKHKPVRLWVYETSSKLLKKFSNGPLTLLVGLAAKIPLISWIRPRKRIQILKSTMTAMKK